MLTRLNPPRPTLVCLLAALLGACGGATRDGQTSSSSGTTGSTSGGVGSAGGGGSGSSSSSSSASSSAGGGAASSSSSGGAGGAGPGGGAGKVVLFESFDAVSETSISDGADHPQPSGFSMGAQHGAVLHFETDPAQSYGGTGKSMRASYPVPSGDVYAWGGVGLDQYATDNVYVRFRAKMPGNRHGLKFLKVFGQNVNGAGYANTTFGLDYTGIDNGSMYAASFGDGTDLTNDTANVVLMDGTNPGWIGRSHGLPGTSVATPQGKAFASAEWGSEWHLFELHVKFNSGTTAANEKNDGELFVRIDGKVYVDAKGLFNRNFLNKPIGSVDVLGWSQGGTMPFDVWYDNIEVSLDDWGNSPV